MTSRLQLELDTVTPPEKDLHEQPQLAGGRASKLQIAAIAIVAIVAVGVALYALDYRRESAKWHAIQPTAAMPASPAVGSSKTNGDTPAGKVATLAIHHRLQGH